MCVAGSLHAYMCKSNLRATMSHDPPSPLGRDCRGACWEQRPPCPTLEAGAQQLLWHHSATHPLRCILSFAQLPHLPMQPLAANCHADTHMGCNKLLASNRSIKQAGVCEGSTSFVVAGWSGSKGAVQALSFLTVGSRVYKLELEVERLDLEHRSWHCT